MMQDDKKKLVQEAVTLPSVVLSRVTLSTRRDGDCAFHAILGHWDRDAKAVVCNDASARRAQLRRALEEAKPDTPIHGLMVAGIQELLMSGRTIGGQSQTLKERYQQFLARQEERTPILWQQFNDVLQQHSIALTYIEEHGQAPGVTTAYDRFYRALAHNEGELYGIILSLPTLQQAFDRYNHERNRGFDWQGALTPALVKEYAAFIEKPHLWLLPSEIAIIADVFDYQITYYPAPTAQAQIMNPGEGRAKVTVQFNGTDHYERQVTQEEAEHLDLSVSALVSVPVSESLRELRSARSDSAYRPRTLTEALSSSSAEENKEQKTPTPDPRYKTAEEVTPAVTRVKSSKKRFSVFPKSSHKTLVSMASVGTQESKEDQKSVVPYTTGAISVEDAGAEAERVQQHFQRILLSTTVLPSYSVTVTGRLGSGAFGQVFQGQWGDRPVALKEIAIEHARTMLGLDADQILESFEWEIARLSALDHPNLVDYYGLYQQDGRYFITMELCPSGTLRDALGGTSAKPKPQRELTLAQRWRIAFEIAQGLAYLHQQGVLHRDLKAENVLLDASGRAKLADLGVAQADVLVETDEADVVKEGLSDLRFQAPEELKGGETSQHSSVYSDMFAYGLVLWELFTGKEPRRLTYDAVVAQLAESQGEREPIPADAKQCPPEFAALMRACWQVDPKRRPTAQTMVSQLETLAEVFHPQPAMAIAQQRTQLLLQEYQSGLAYYVPSFSVPYVLEEDPDVFWQAYEAQELTEAKSRAIAAKVEVKEDAKQDSKTAAPEVKQEIQQESKAVESKVKTEEKQQVKQEISLGAEIKEAKDEKAVATLAARDRLQPIDRALRTFMADPAARVLVIFGDGGFGKSSAVYDLLDDLLRQPTPSHLPLLVRPGLGAWRHSALTDGLNQASVSPVYGLSAAQRTALRAQPVVWVVDGYDELARDQTPQNLPQQLGLAQWPQAKLIVTCRPQTVPVSEQRNRFGWGTPSTFQYHQLLPFRQTQVLDYLQHRLGWSDEQRDTFGKTVSETPSLRALLRTPFILQRLVESWDVLQDQPLDQLDRFNLYERSIEYELKEQTQLLPPEVQRSLQGNEVSLLASFIAMAENLAAYGHAQDQASVPLSTALQQLPAYQAAWLQLPRLVSMYAKHEYKERQEKLDPEQRHRVILSQNDYVRLRRTQLEHRLQRSPFKNHHQRQAHDYRHRSLYEYWVAHALISRLRSGDQVGVYELLRHRLIQQEMGIAAFTREAYRAQSTAEQNHIAQELIRLVRVSAEQKLPTGLSDRAYRWSANAATLLNYYGINLNRQRWAGVQVPGADFSYGQLAHTDLNNANLRGATLMHTIFYQANLQNADLRDVHWGQWPWVELDRPIRTMAHHPTQPWIAVIQDKTIVLIDTESGRQIGSPLTGHTDRVYCLAFSPDGQRIISGSWDNTLRLWDTEHQKAIGEPLTGHTDWVQCVAFSPDGDRIVSGSTDKTLRLWDATRCIPIGAPMTGGHTGSVDCVAFSPDGRRLVSGSEDGTLRLWDAVHQRAIGEPLIGHEDYVSCVAFSPDSQRIVSGSGDCTLRLWSVANQTALGIPLIGHSGSVECVAFSPDGRRIVSGSSDRTLRLWDAIRQSVIGEPLTGHTGEVRCVVFSPDGLRVISGSSDKTLRLWATARQTEIDMRLTGHTKRVNCLAFSSDGLYAVSGSLDETLRLWDASLQATIGAPLAGGHTGSIECVAFSPDNQYIVSGSLDHTLRLWDVARRSPVGVPLVGHTDEVHCVAFSPDGLLVASGSFDKTLRLWDPLRRTAVGAPLTGHTNRVSCVAFSPSGLRFVSGSLDETLRLWDAVRRIAIGEPFTGHTHGVTCVAFSPDGLRLVSGSLDETLRVWDAVRRIAIGEPFTGHTDRVMGVAFSPDGRRLISGSLDHTLRLWDVVSGRCLAVIKWCYGIRCLAVNQRPRIHHASTSIAEQKNLDAYDEYQVMIGDIAGMLSLWTVVNDTILLASIQRHSAMPLWFAGADLKGVQVDRVSRRLIEQHEGNVGAAIEPTESKARVNSTSFSGSSGRFSSVAVAEVKSSATAPTHSSSIGSFSSSSSSSSASRSSRSSSVSSSATEIKLTVAATPSTMGLFAHSSISSAATTSVSSSTTTAAEPEQKSVEAQRTADVAWLDALEKQLDDSLDFHDSEQLLLCLRHTDAIEAARKHCQTAPLTPAQRNAMTAIADECKERIAKKAVASTLPRSA